MCHFSIKILFWACVTQYHLHCEPGHPEDKRFSAPHREVCFQMFSIRKRCLHTGSAMATVAVIGRMLRSTKRKGQRSEMKGGSGDTQQSRKFLGHVYTAGFTGAFIQSCIKVLASVCCLRQMPTLKKQVPLHYHHSMFQVCSSDWF